MNNLRIFEYRQPRLITSYQLEFSVGDEVFHGLCTDISRGGLRVSFDEEIEIGTLGSLLLHYADSRLRLDAVVAHLEDGQAGLTFVCRSPEERALSEQIVSLLAGTAGWQ